MKGVTIYPPEWLASHAYTLDAIVMAFEGNYEEEVTQQIQRITSIPLHITSWKSLVKKL
ncbi:hypothetical protein D3C73_1625890 [compost metagenome]